MLLKKMLAIILYMGNITHISWAAIPTQEPKKNVKARDEGKAKKTKESHPRPDPIKRRIELRDGSSIQDGWIDMGCGDSY